MVRPTTLIDLNTTMTVPPISWKESVRDLSPGLLSYFMARFPRHIAADLVQEVQLRLVLKVRSGSFDEQKGSLRMYAYGIARYVALEAQKHEGSSYAELDPDELSAPAKSSTDDRDQLRWAIDQLKPMEREILLLLLDKDLALAEIATIVELPLGTVKSHIHRAKSSLKAILDRVENETETR